MIAYATFVALAGVAAWSVRAAARREVRAPATMALMGGAAVVMLLVTRGTPLGDFLKAYYRAGRFALGEPLTLYGCEVSNLCFVNLPIVALAFAPFAWLPPWPAGLVFSAAALAASAAGAWMLASPAAARGPALREVVLWLVVLNGPLVHSVRLGNTTHLLLPVLVAALRRLAHRDDAPGGALLGLLAVVKPPLALLLAYLLVRGRLRAATGMAGAIALLVVLSVAVFGWPLHERFWTDIVVGFGSAPVAAYNAQSLSGAIAHLLRPGHLRDFEPLAQTPAFLALRALSTAAVLLLAWLACRSAGPPETREARLAELSMVLVLALLVAPIAWTHYFLLLLVPVCALVAGELPLPRAGRAWLWGACVLLSLPSTFFTLPWPRLAAVHERIFASHYTAGAVLLLALLAAARLHGAGAGRAAGAHR